MCFVDDSLARPMKKKSSVGGGDDVDRNIDDDEDDEDDEDFGRKSTVAPPPSSQLPSQSHSANDEGEEKGLAKDDRIGVAPLSMQKGHNNSTCKNNRTIKSSRTVETILPNVIWLEHILPCLDRSSWNALMEASKPIYMLAMISKLTAEYQGRRISADASTSTAQPPWPTNRSFQSKSGGQGQAIESITMSHDGEFMACGSVIGSIDVWNLRTGKIQWKAKQTTSNQTQYATSFYDTAEERAQYPNYFALGNNARGRRASASQSSSSSTMQRRSAPLGSVLRFSQGGGYTLACGFENRVFVWDLEKELRRKNPRMNRHHQEMTTEATPSLPLHKQHHIFVPLSKRKQSEDQERRRHRGQDQNDLCYQTLEIECNHGTIYEVTYLGFSNTFNSNNGPHRLIARYGKTAYIWTTLSSAGEASPRYILTHSIPLSSSRCQMVSNLSLTKLAVATNGGSSRRNNARQNEEESSTPSSNNKIVDGKGIIHVWDLQDALTQRDQSTMQNECRNIESVSKISSDYSTRIVAYPDHVVRGLEFLQVNDTNVTTPTSSALSCNTNVDSESCLLVSASLQGEVKFWKKYTPTQTHPRDRYSNNCSSNDGVNTSKNCIADESEKQSFVCVYQFQSPGKIFSLASWSSISSLTGEHKILLAAGEARGQVRVWKVLPNFLSTPSSSSACEVSLGSCGKSGSNNGTDSKQQRLEECLSTEVGDHVHYDNIKLLAFTPNGKSLAVSRAYDAKIWFQTVWQ